MRVGTHCYSSGDFFNIYQHEDINIGNYVQIGGDVQLFDQPDHISIYNPKSVHNYPPQMIGAKPVIHGKRGRLTIGHDVWIGNSATLFGGIEIGNGAIIGAYSVVAKTIPPYAVVVGNPAKVIRYRFTEDQIVALEKIKWWNWSKDKVKQSVEDMSDVDKFIKKYEVVDKRR